MTRPAVPPPRDQVDEILAQWAKERPDLDASPMGILGRVCRLAPLLTQEQVRVFARHGLDFASFDVLATLRRSGPPHALTPSQLSRAMMVTPGAVAHRLARLESELLVSRAHDHPDRRVVTVTLTPRGQEVIDAALPDHLENERRLLRGFTEVELGLLADLLRRMLVDAGDLPAGIIEHSSTDPDDPPAAR